MCSAEERKAGRLGGMTLPIVIFDSSEAGALRHIAVDGIPRIST